MHKARSATSAGGKRTAMKKTPRVTEEQILAILKEAEAGASADDLCTKHGISSSTLARWRTKHGNGGGLWRSELRRLKQLEEENRRLRVLVTDLTLSNQALKQAVSKKW